MLAIQILGVSGHKLTNALTKNTLTAINELGLIAKVEEVFDIDHLITYDISGVPAMVIDGELRFQQCVPAVEDLKLLTKVLTNSTNKKEIHEKYIVPN